MASSVRQISRRIGAHGPRFSGDQREAVLSREGDSNYYSTASTCAGATCRTSHRDGPVRVLRIISRADPRIITSSPRSCASSSRRPRELTSTASAATKNERRLEERERETSPGGDIQASSAPSRAPRAPGRCGREVPDLQAQLALTTLASLHAGAKAEPRKSGENRYGNEVQRSRRPEAETAKLRENNCVLSYERSSAANRHYEAPTAPGAAGVAVRGELEVQASSRRSLSSAKQPPNGAQLDALARERPRRSTADGRGNAERNRWKGGERSGRARRRDTRGREAELARDPRAMPAAEERAHRRPPRVRATETEDERGRAEQAAGERE